MGTGKKILRLDKVNHVLSLFGAEVGVVLANQPTYEKAKVFFREEFAGILNEYANGYIFKYNPNYLKSDHTEAISLTFP